MDFVSNEKGVDVNALSKIMNNVSLLYSEEESRQTEKLINVIRSLGEEYDSPSLEPKVVSLSELREDVPRDAEPCSMKIDEDGYFKTTLVRDGDN